jgi:hypothetical protein
MKKYKIAVLDDYQNVALESADWSVLRDRAEIAVFQNHLAVPTAPASGNARLRHVARVHGWGGRRRRAWDRRGPHGI